MSDKRRTYHYFKVKSLSSDMKIEFADLKEFSRFVDLNRIKNIYVRNSEDKEQNCFAVSHKGGLIHQATEGYESLEDYYDCMSKKFPDANAYYEAKDLGYDNYEDYRLVKESGMEGKSELEEVKDLGYITGFEELRNGGENLSDIGPFTNALELFEYAKTQSFESYEELKSANSVGFTQGDQYRIAIEKGFETKEDFETAKEAGFHTAQDWIFAQKRNIKNVEELQLYLDLSQLETKAKAFDQRLLLILLSKLPDGRKVSINKLEELLNESLEEYRNEETKELFSWFLKEIESQSDIATFLRSEDLVKKYGHYDSDGEFFQTNHLKDRMVVLDGSNVAHNSNGDSKSKPSVANMIKLVKELKNRGFREISVMVDASLRHRLQDKEKLDELEKLASYMETPAGTPADIFIIRFVKMHHCLLVSNDNFREWKATDPWIAQNIDFYRLSFMIKGDTVLIPDLNKN